MGPRTRPITSSWHVETCSLKNCTRKVILKKGHFLDTLMFPNFQVLHLWSNFGQNSAKILENMLANFLVAYLSFIFSDLLIQVKQKMNIFLALKKDLKIKYIDKCSIFTAHKFLFHLIPSIASPIFEHILNVFT